MTDNKVSLLSDVSSDYTIAYQKIGEQRKQNRFAYIFGSYLALPLISIILVVTILILFFILKIYFINSYMYALQDNLNNKKTIDISGIIDNRYDTFRNFKKPLINTNVNSNSVILNSLTTGRIQINNKKE